MGGARTLRFGHAARALLVGAALGVAACADAGDEAKSAFTIEGTVRDEYTERGVVGAKVHFVSDTLDRAETTSEADGRFELTANVHDGVEFGTIQAERAGYAASRKWTVFFDDSEHRIDLVLRPND